jgi:hypothetical protein
MSNKFYTILGLLLLLINVAFTQNSALLQDENLWQALYWNNKELSGPPILQRIEVGASHNWGDGSPDPVISSDNFSARWIRDIQVNSGLHRFTVRSDDGVRVWVDGNIIIDKWYDHGAETFRADRDLSTGRHQVMIDYYENTGAAVLEFSWSSIASTAEGWRGEYYNNTSLSGDPIFVRQDSQINFNWGDGSPAPGYISSDYFSVRWRRTVNFAGGTYRFSVISDDGARLWINGELLINAWQVQSAKTYVTEVSLPKGATRISLEYFENTGGAVAQLNATRLGPNDDDDDEGPTYVDWNNVLPRQWRKRVPPQYHAPIQACIDYFNRIHKPIHHWPPDYQAILNDCADYLNGNTNKDHNVLRQLAPLMK